MPEQARENPEENLLEQRCENCVFWDEKIVDAGGWGRCRRFPPSRGKFEHFAEGGAANVGEWPATQDTDWCGEWRLAGTHP